LSKARTKVLPTIHAVPLQSIYLVSSSSAKSNCAETRIALSPANPQLASMHPQFFFVEEIISFDYTVGFTLLQYSGTGVSPQRRGAASLLWIIHLSTLGYVIRLIAPVPKNWLRDKDAT
jgi:hypothetical protein